jgi:hypothetical protein
MGRNEQFGSRKDHADLSSRVQAGFRHKRSSNPSRSLTKHSVPHAEPKLADQKLSYLLGPISGSVRPELHSSQDNRQKDVGCSTKLRSSGTSRWHK